MLKKQNSSSKFETVENIKTSSTSVLLPRFTNRKEEVVKSKVMNIECADSMGVPNEDFNYCEFSVTEDGGYLVSSQLCVKLNGGRTITDFIQHGICELNHIEDGMIESHLINDSIEEGFAISKNLSGLMQLKKDTKYVCWILLSSENNANFSYEKLLSSCNLFCLN